MSYNTNFNELQSPNKGLAISGGAQLRADNHAASTKQNVFSRTGGRWHYNLPTNQA